MDARHGMDVVLYESERGWITSTIGDETRTGECNDDGVRVYVPSGVAVV